MNRLNCNIYFPKNESIEICLSFLLNHEHLTIPLVPTIFFFNHLTHEWGLSNEYAREIEASGASLTRKRHVITWIMRVFCIDILLNSRCWSNGRVAREYLTETTYKCCHSMSCSMTRNYQWPLLSLLHVQWWLSACRIIAQQHPCRHGDSCYWASIIMGGNKLWL